MQFEPVTPNYSHNKPRAKGGYVCFLTNPDQHTNAAASHPGFGSTPKAAAEDACYWANQAPWCVTVPIAKAPAWVRTIAEFWWEP